MFYYEVAVADSHFRADKPLTYSSEDELKSLNIVTVPLQNRAITGFVIRKVRQPEFKTKSIKTLLSAQPLPKHCLKLASWLQDYYCVSFGDALRQFAPNRPTIRRTDTQPKQLSSLPPAVQIEFSLPLTTDQRTAIKAIAKSPSTTILLHGETGSGKTRVYLELAREALNKGCSVMFLTPEIALTSQLAAAVRQLLPYPAYVLHSQLSSAKRKRIWFGILEAKEPIVIIGPRSALFSPVNNLELIIMDEAHEPAYKQQQSPRYHAARLASQLGHLADSKVIMGTATPSIADYYLAKQHNSVVRMREPAIKHSHGETVVEIIDIKDRRNFSRNPYLSNQLIDAIRTTLSAKQQVILYLNRRGSARLILCNACGWQLLCPNCDVPLIYHGDQHITRCHICGHSRKPPSYCPKCQNPDIIYRSIGTKALVEVVARLFPEFKSQRFDSDNLAGEHINEVYHQLRVGKIDILIGTQLLAKGFDLPRLGLVGIVAAETSLALPDFTSEERAFQLLYQVMGRVGRGHSQGHVVVQSYDPNNMVLRTATGRNFNEFYKHALSQRQQFRFPPYAHLLQLSCRRATEKGAVIAAERLKRRLAARSASWRIPVEIIGPAPSFYARRGRQFYYQLVLKSKKRVYLQKLAELVPQDWTIDLDPINLL
ncbi:primosomal protein N' [Candidatus Saccharibacteria bacterium]|nr:primosomal protein N' [Candidatus Saccharibacteria bacterium]